MFTPTSYFFCLPRFSLFSDKSSNVESCHERIQSHTLPRSSVIEILLSNYQVVQYYRQPTAAPFQPLRDRPRATSDLATSHLASSLPALLPTQVVEWLASSQQTSNFQSKGSGERCKKGSCTQCPQMLGKESHSPIPSLMLATSISESSGLSMISGHPYIVSSRLTESKDLSSREVQVFWP